MKEPSVAGQGFGDPNSVSKAHRAAQPRAPQLPAALRRVEAERASVLQEREAVERRSVLRGLILLALVVLILCMLHAGVARVFPTGWRQW